MTSTFPLRRARQRIGALASLGAIVALTTGALSALLGTAAALTDAGVRDALASSDATASSARITTRVADDADAQDRDVRAAIARAMRGAPVEVTRTLRSDPVPLTIISSASQGTRLAPAVLYSVDDLPSLAELRDGGWPSSADELALQVDAADALGARVGAEIGIAGRVFTVAATWEPRDAGEPAWFGDPGIGSGEDEGAAGPVVVGAGALTSLEIPIDARWTIVPTVASVDAEGLSALSSALERLSEEVRVLGQGDIGGVALAGTLDQRLSTLHAATLASNAVIGVPIVLIAILGVIVAVVVLRSIVEGRQEEVALLRARGASIAGLVTTAIGESSAVGLVGAVIGAALGAGVLGVVGSRSALVVAAPTVIAVAGAGVVVAATVAAIVNLRELRRTGAPVPDDTRAAAVVAIAPLVTSVILAGLALTQFLVLGSPLAEGARADPLALTAPALVLVALAMCASFSSGPVFAVLEATARRGRGILPVLPLRQLTRHGRSTAAAVLTVALATGASLFAAVYDGSSAASEAQAVRAATGADVRVQYERDGDVSERVAGVGADASAFAAGATVDDALALVRTDVTIGADPVPAIAADPERLAVLTADAALNRVASRLTSARTEVALPDRTDRLRVQLDVRANADVPADARLAVIAWLADADGAPLRVPLGELAVSPGSERSASMTADVSAPRSVLAVEYEPTALPAGASMTVSLTRLQADDADVPWPEDREVRSAGSSEPFRLLPRSAVHPVPIVITSALAERLNRGVGDQLSVRVGGGPLAAEVDGIVDRLPGIPGGIGAIVDLATVAGAQLAAGSGVPATNEVWISTALPQRTAAAVRDSLTRRAEVLSGQTISMQPVIGPNVALLWAGVSVSLVLSMVGFVAVTSSTEGTRRREAVPLRSLGMTVRMLGRSRAMEILSTAAVALVLGAAAGVLASSLVVGGLVESITGESITAWAVLPGVTAVCAIAAVAGGLALLAKRATGRRDTV